MLIVDLPDDLPLVRVDAGLIEQALGNLLENAAKHTPPERWCACTPSDATTSWSCRSRTLAAAPVGGRRAALREIPPRLRRRRGRRHRFGACDLPRDRPAARWQGLGRARAGRRHRVSLHASGRGSSARFPPRPQTSRHDRTRARPSSSSRMSRTSGASCALSLGAEGYRVVESATGRRGAIDAGTHKPDLAIVDLGLPDSTASRSCDEYANGHRCPILILSARVQERLKDRSARCRRRRLCHEALRVGELLARVRVALRHAMRSRSGSQHPAVRTSRRWIWKTAGNVRDGVEVRLTPIEFRLLAALAQAPGHGRHAPAVAGRGVGTYASGRYALPSHLHEATARQAGE